MSVPQVKSGNILREARERKGYDLTTVARRLRIRPDILRAIEAGDFSSMPPRGYTRNMVNAYARFLGLNPTDIVNKYLDEAYANQIEKARRSAPGSGFVMEGDYQRRPRLRSRDRDRDDDMEPISSYVAGASSGRRGAGSDLPYPNSPRAMRAMDTGRDLFDDSTPYSHDGYGVNRRHVGRAELESRDYSSHHSGYDARERQAPREGRWRERQVQVGQTPMEYSAPLIPAFFKSRPFIIGAIAVVALIVIFFIVSALTSGGGEAKPADDVSTLPVSGISDTTGTSDEQASEEAQVEIAPTSARVVYSVSSGDDCYVELYTDGEASDAQMLSGPVQETVEVTGTWTVTTWSPDTIEVTVDGTGVELVSNAEYGGMYAYTVDFPQILAEWNATHGGKGAQRQAAVASASNALVQDSKAAAAAAEKEEEDELAGSGSSSSTALDKVE